jgi:hypothetical protein
VASGHRRGASPIAERSRQLGKGVASLLIRRDVVDKREPLILSQDGRLDKDAALPGTRVVEHDFEPM